MEAILSDSKDILYSFTHFIHIAFCIVADHCAAQFFYCLWNRCAGYFRQLIYYCEFILSFYCRLTFNGL